MLQHKPFFFKLRHRLVEKTTPGPSLQKGEEPCPAAPLTGQRDVSGTAPCYAADCHGSPPSFKEGTGVVKAYEPRIFLKIKPKPVYFQRPHSATR